MFLLLVALAAPVPAGKSAGGWVGVPVFRLGDHVRLYTDRAGTAAVGGQLYMHYRVVGDEGDRLRVVHDGKAGWFKKAEVLRPAAAVPHFEALAKASNTANVWNYHAIALKEADRIDEAVAVFDRLIAESPTTPTWYNNRATVKMAARRYDEAVADLTRAVEMAPQTPIYLRNRGWANLTRKKYADALADLDQAVPLEPTKAAALVYRARAKAFLGDFAGAAADAKTALVNEPLNSSALSVRGWLLAVSPDAVFRDGKEALRLTEEACDLTGWAAAEVDAHAAACAEVGDFAAAARWQAQALRDAKFKAANGPEAEARLALYRTGKPFRVAPVGK